MSDALSMGADVDYVLRVYKPRPLLAGVDSSPRYVAVDSPDVPGLHVAELTAGEALGLVPPMVDRLRRDNGVKSNSPRGEEPRAAPTSTPASGSEQHEVGTAGESPSYDPRFDHVMQLVSKCCEEAWNMGRRGDRHTLQVGLQNRKLNDGLKQVRIALEALWKSSPGVESPTDFAHPFYSDGSEAAQCRWCSKPESAHPPGEIATRAGFHLRLIRRLISLDLNVADDVVQELMAQDRELASLRAEVASKQSKIDALMLEHCPDEMTPEQTEEWAQSQQAVKRSSVHEGDCPRPVSREEELFAIWHRAKTATGLDLERLAVKVHLLRVLCPAEPDDSLRKRIQCAVSLALGVRQSILERSDGEAQRLRAALTATRGQWIHSVNAARCLEALGEQASADTHAEDLEFDKALEDALEDLDFAPEPLEVYDSNSWRRVGLKRRYHTVMFPCKQRDGHPDISRPKVLRALVAAFNAMLARRPTP